MVIMVKRSRFRSSGRSFLGNGVTIPLRYSSSPVTAVRRYLTGGGEGVTSEVTATTHLVPLTS